MRRFIKFLPLVMIGVIFSYSSNVIAQMAICDGATTSIDPSTFRSGSEAQAIQNIFDNYDQAQYLHVASNTYQLCFQNVSTALLLRSQINFQSKENVADTRPVVISGLNISRHATATIRSPLLIIRSNNNPVTLRNVTIAGVNNAVRLGGTGAHSIVGGNITGNGGNVSGSIGVHVAGANGATIDSTTISRFEKGVFVEADRTSLKNGCEIRDNAIGVHVPSIFSRTSIERCKIFNNDDNDDTTLSSSDAIRFDGTSRQVEFWKERPGQAAQRIQPESAGIIRYDGSGTPAISFPSTSAGITFRKVELYVSDCGTEIFQQPCDFVDTPINIDPSIKQVSYTVPQQAKDKTMIALYTDDAGTTTVSRPFNMSQNPNSIVLIGLSEPIILPTTPGAAPGDQVAGGSSGSTGGSGSCKSEECQLLLEFSDVQTSKPKETSAATGTSSPGVATGPTSGCPASILPEGSLNASLIGFSLWWIFTSIILFVVMRPVLKRSHRNRRN